MSTRRGFLRTLIGAAVASPTVTRGLAVATPLPVAPAAIVVTGSAAILDIRAILIADMLLDIQTEEDRLFIERVKACVNHQYEQNIP